MKASVDLHSVFAIISPVYNNLMIRLDAVANALIQIGERQYEVSLLANGSAPEQIEKYGLVFLKKHI